MSQEPPGPTRSVRTALPRGRAKAPEHFRFTAAVLVVGAAFACSAEPGRVNVDFAWDVPEARRPRAGEVWLHASVRFPPNGRVSAPPVEYRPGETLRVSDIPNGTGRILVVEMRETADPGSPLIFYGRSVPFRVEAGAATRVGLPVVLGDAPDLRDIEVRSPMAGPFVSSPVVRLSGQARGADVLIIAQDTEFALGRVELELETESDAPGDDGFREFEIDYDLDRERTCPAPPCDGTRTVFFRAQREGGPFFEGPSVDAPDALRFELDRSPPQVIDAALTIAAPSGSPLPNPAAATLGSTVTVTLVATEAVAIDPLPALGLRGRAAPVIVEAETVTQGTVQWRFAIDERFAEDVYALQASLVDRANNGRTVDLSGLSLSVFSGRPSLLVDTDAVSYLRSPVGAAQEQIVGGAPVPAGSYFALVEADPWSGAGFLPDSAFGFDEGRAVVRLRVWGDADLGTRLGEVQRDSAGRWPRVELVSLDVPAIWVSGIDEAGNESTPVAIPRTWWVETSRREGSLQGMQVTLRGRDDGPVEGTGIEAGAEELGSPDGSLARARADWRWSPLLPAEEPGPRAQVAMAFDPRRGRHVVFEGFEELTTLEGWGWDGQRWQREAAPFGTVLPVGRRGYGVTYDGRRRRVLLFGGRNVVSAVGDLWAWDGELWDRLDPPGDQPSPRSAPAVAYDSERDELVVFGGVAANLRRLDDTWTFDGERWSLRQPTTSPELTESRTGFAFDPGRGVAVLLGARDVVDPNDPTAALRSLEIWEWSGSDWRRAFDHRWRFDLEAQRWDSADGTPEGPDPGEIGAPFANIGGTTIPMVYDAAAQHTVLVGSSGRLFGWDGTLFAVLGPGPGSVPPRRQSFAASYDLETGQIVTFGGVEAETGTELDETWCWDDDGWTRRGGFETPDGARDAAWRWAYAGPSVSTILSSTVAEAEARFVYDVGRDRLVLADAHEDAIRIREWDRSLWRVPETDSAPPAREAFALAFGAPDGRTLLFGGRTSSGDFRADTWAWDGAEWSSVGTAPAARANAGLARGPSELALVLFGGATAAGVLSDSWLWDGSSWSALGPPNAPTPRSSVAMAYASSVERTLLFGGAIASGAELNDLWSFDGATWDDVTPAIEGSPSPRSGAEFVFDEAQHRLVLVRGLRFGREEEDAWSLEPPNRPMAVSTLELLAGLEPDRVTRFDVVAYCGGASPSGPGAELSAERWGGAGYASGVWERLDENRAARGAGPDESRMLVSKTDADDVPRFFSAPEGQLRLACAPREASRPGQPSEVAVDYFEVRVLTETLKP